MAGIDWIFNSMLWGIFVFFIGLGLFHDYMWAPFISVALLLACSLIYLAHLLRTLFRTGAPKVLGLSNIFLNHQEGPTEIWNWNFKKNRVCASTLDFFPLRNILGSPKTSTPEDFLLQFHEGDRRLVLQAIEASQVNLVDLQVEARGADNEKNWYLLKAKLIKDRKGKARRLVGFTIENTQRKHTENRIREVESRFRALANTISALTWMSDENGNYVYYNRAWLDFVGHNREEEFIQNWMDFIHPEDQKMYRKELEDTFLKREKSNAQFRILRSDGEYRWMWYSGIPRVIGEQSAHGYMGSLVDITDRLISEKARRQNQQTEQKLETLMQIVPVGIFQTDEFGQFVYVNDQWTQMTGLTVANSIQNNWLNAIHPDDREEVGTVWFENIHTSTHFDFDCRILNISLQPIWASWKVAVLKDPKGQILGFTGTIIDINSHKELETTLISAREKALESSRLKSTFLANMSHEIRTPLNAVIGLTGLLLKTSLDEDQLDYAQTIKISGESLLSLINDTLDLSKVEANRLNLEKIDFNLKQWLQESTEGFIHSAKLRNLQFKIDMDFSDELCVEADPARLRQIINNLLGNAIKFTEKGYVKLKACVEKKGDSMEFLCEVIDSGIGISSTALPKMFKPFSQADASTTRRYGGTGLGLSICAGLIELMDGEIGVDSEEKQGSRFWFRIPLQQASRTPFESVQKNENSQGKKSNQRFLVVDDNPINQKVAVKILEKMGHYADAVGNGLEAINSIESLPYDMILMDCQMPEMDGYEATRRIRGHSRLELRRVPIVAMTANAVQGDREKCIDSGMNDYLSKPLRVEELCSVIDNYLY